MAQQRLTQNFYWLSGKWVHFLSDPARGISSSFVLWLLSCPVSRKEPEEVSLNTRKTTLPLAQCSGHETPFLNTYPHPFSRILRSWSHNSLHFCALSTHHQISPFTHPSFTVFQQSSLPHSISIPTSRPPPWLFSPSTILPYIYQA